MNWNDRRLAMKIREASKKITKEDLLREAEYLDEATFFTGFVAFKFRDKLKELEKLLRKKYDIGEDECYLEFEYHLDDNTTWYGLWFEDDVITITEYMRCSYMEDLIRETAKELWGSEFEEHQRKMNQKNKEKRRS